jgi:hypothetical protein
LKTGFLRGFVSAVLAASLLAACAPERLARGVYEGTRARNDSLKGSPRENPKGELPGYDQYEKERQTPAR